MSVNNPLAQNFWLSFGLIGTTFTLALLQSCKVHLLDPLFEEHRGDTPIPLSTRFRFLAKELNKWLLVMTLLYIASKVIDVCQSQKQI